MNTVEEKVTVEVSDTIIPILPPAVAAVEKSAKAVEHQARRLEEETRRWQRYVENESDGLRPSSVPAFDPIVVERELIELQTRVSNLAANLLSEIEVLNRRLERIENAMPDEKKKL